MGSSLPLGERSSSSEHDTKRMTPARFHACLSAIGWSQRALADRLGIHETRVRRWASSKYPIPETVAAWLERLAKAHEKEPWPTGWMENITKASPPAA
jgi:ribosome-binding protein aMBF1 (putative translation factor)